ncbi:MAG: hypothetical protein AB7P03_05875 [Kofleriaceae bacterium]
MKSGLTTISLDTLTSVTGGKGAAARRPATKKKSSSYSVTDHGNNNRCDTSGSMIKLDGKCKW